MTGLMFVFAVALYLVLLLSATWIAYRLVRKRGWSIIASSAAALVTFLAIYLPVFWDHLPTVIAHKSYCSNEAKFVVLKTVEEWSRENPEAAALLRYDARAANVPVGDARRFPLNQRIVSEYENPKSVFLTVTRREAKIIDIKNGDVLAQFVDFQAGPAPLGVGGEGWWKLWLQRRSCDLSDNGFEVPFSQYTANWIKLAEAKK